MNKLVEAFKVLTDIENVSSTNSKKEILTASRENLPLQYILKSAYDPFTQFFIKKIPTDINDCTNTEVSEDRYKELDYLLTELSSRKITGNNAIERLSKFLKSCSPEEYKWYSRVIQKDLKIGMADKGINAVIKNLIPTYEVLLADKILPNDLVNRDSKTLKALPNEFVTQYKIDGYRLNIWLREDGTVEIRTRNGKTVAGYTDLENEAKAKLPKGYVYDGEVVAPELFEWIESNKNNTDTTANRDLFTEVMSHAFSKEANKKGIFNMFDMVPINEWTAQKTTEPLSARLQRIKDTIETLDLTNIRVVPTSRVYNKNNEDDLNELMENFKKFLNVGWEGIMIKNTHSVYEFKRSKNLIKMKQMDNLDLTVIELFEGTGKYQGMMGGVYVDYKGFKVGVGSGWTDEQRAAYWNNPNLILGKTIEIAYQAETKNKQGGLSLSFPVVVKVRDDK